MANNLLTEAPPGGHARTFITGSLDGRDATSSASEKERSDSPKANRTSYPNISTC